jgi:hypothetical protein
MMASRRILLLVLVILLLLLFLAVPGVSWADTLEDAGWNLARKIAAALPDKQGVALDFQNSSTLGPTQAALIRRVVEGELAKQGHLPIAVISVSEAVHVRVSETIGEYLLVAQIPRDPTVTFIVSLAKSEVPVTVQVSSGISIKWEMVFEQGAPFLDFALIPRPGNRLVLAVLEPEAISFRERVGDQWGQKPTLPLPRQKFWPRDLRGWIRAARDHMEIFLPGLYGYGELGSDSPWIRDWGTWKGRPIAHSSGPDWTDFALLTEGRNYFGESGGSETPNSQSSRFFSIANLAERGSGAYAGWVKTNLDGLARLFDSRGEVRAVIHGWGSEIAGVTSQCGNRRQVLVSRAGDWTVPGAVQTYEIVEEQAVAVGPPLEFSGPVMALWTAEDESSVRAVVRNLKTGHYEAYRLTINCGK